MFDSLCTMFCHLRVICLAPLLSLPQPYKTQQRLAVVFSTLCAALAFNAACFGPATELFSGDFSVSFGASLCMIVINQLFSQLYVAAAQSAAERHSLWSFLTLLTHAALLAVVVASIFLCLVYSLPFDSALSARWLYVVMLSFAQSFFLTGPLWICFKAAFYIVLARFRMRGMTLQEQQKAALALKLGTNESSETLESKGSSGGPHEAIEMSTIATSAAPHSARAPPASSAHQHGGFQEFQDEDDVEVSHRNHLPRTIDRTMIPANTVVNPLFANFALAGKELVVVPSAQTPSDSASKRVSIAISDAARFDIVPNIASASDSEANSRSNSSFLVLEHNSLFNPALLQAATRSEAKAAHAPAAAAAVHVTEVASSSPMAVPTPPRSGARTSLFLSANPLFNRSALSEAVGDGVGLDEFTIPTDNRMVILSPHTMSLSHNALFGMNLAAAASSAAANGDDSESSGPLATQ
jgi:hypothetical protein